ncbi:MAG: hypothetical protein ACKVYV_09405 [Limisphaerales bacterium]
MTYERLRLRFALACGAALMGGGGAVRAADASGLALVPFSATNAPGGVRLVAGATGAPALFRAVTVRDARWPAGLVPLFEAGSGDRSGLRRLPPRGRENLTEPLGFILPRADEPDAARLAGWWDIRAVGADGTKRWLGMELAVDGERVAGRLDQLTDYRFAHVTGGSWRTNVLTLGVEYVNDRYELTATWRDGRLSGAWRRTDDSDRGTWEATRTEGAPPLPAAAGAVPLFEWQRTDGTRRYAPEPGPAGEGWTPAQPPLGRVWPPP